jgi:hypothetical protein
MSYLERIIKATNKVSARELANARDEFPVLGPGCSFQARQWLWQDRHFSGVRDLTQNEVEFIIELAQEMRDAADQIEAILPEKDAA